MTPEDLMKIIKSKGIEAELITFKESVKDSKSSATASNLDLNKIVKTITFKDKQKNVHSVIIRATERVCKSKLKKVIQGKTQLIPFDDVIKYTGFPAGGVPPFGYKANFIMDQSLKDEEVVLLGGGSIYSLIKISIKDLKKLNEPTIADIKQES